MRVDRAGFEQALEEQRERSRGGKKAELSRHAEMTGAVRRDPRSRRRDDVSRLRDDNGSEARSSRSCATEPNTRISRRCAEAELRLPAEAEAEIVLDRTPFYAEGGGQVGDQGVLRATDGSVVFTVRDTQKPSAGLIVHRGTLHGRIAVGETVVAEVDSERRARTMRNHTATHLLHRALRNNVGERARQAGSLVSPDYLRFDFPLRPRADRRGEARDRGRGAARRARQPHGHAALHDAWPRRVAEGADAFFDEKYGEKVRVMFVDGYSRELCGGTHCSATGQIGSFVITGERSIGSGMRRIEALTGDTADEYLAGRVALLDARNRRGRRARRRLAAGSDPRAARAQQRARSAPARRRRRHAPTGPAGAQRAGRGRHTVHCLRRASSTR